MKRILSFVLALLLAASLTACGSETALQDGYYTAQAAEFSHGWKEYITIMVKGGSIVSVGENNFREEIHSGEFSLNLRNRYLLKCGQPIELTQVEFQIMEYFFSNPATALDRTDILKHVWGESLH